MHAGLLLLFGNLVAAIANLIRNILAARLLEVSDFGIANTFTILIILMNIVFALGLGTFIVQDREGESPVLMATAHTLTLAQGGLAALLMLAGAAPFAAFMGAPEATWAFAGLAVTALMLGGQNLDYHRQQRASVFRATMIISAVPIVGSTLVLWPLVAVFGDWRAMFWVLIVQMTLTLILTHLLAQRRWRAGLDRIIARRALAFGLPLLGDSLFFVAMLNTDRMVIANRFGLEVLAFFSVAFMLTVLPVSILTRSLQTIFVARLAQLRDAPEAFAPMARLTAQTFLAASLALAVGFALAGPTLVLILYGTRYGEAIPFLLILGVMQGLRLMRAGPLSLALATGRSTPNLIASATRFGFIVIAVIAAYGGMEIRGFLLIGVAGELAALCVAFWAVRGGFGRGAGVSELALALALMLVTFGAILALSDRPAPAGLWPLDLVWGHGGVAVLALVTLALLRSLWRWLITEMSRRRKEPAS
ncbi:MAG: oligosaccharide flippase family protein [Pseudomonadota bacterium]